MTELDKFGWLANWKMCDRIGQQAPKTALAFWERFLFVPLFCSNRTSGATEGELA